VVVVLATNVIYSGLRSSLGASFQLIRAVREVRLTSVVTVPLMFEYEDVLTRPGVLPHLSPQDISGFLDWLVSVSNCYAVHFLWRPFLHDAKDDLVLEAAVTARVDYLVTYNTRDFAGAETFGVSVITPAKLSNLLRL
jgi:putative PIN family toxin of toxin-antitoxin system